MTPPAAGTARPVVIDTNIVLDLFVFHEPTLQVLRDALHKGALHWVATQAMQDELVRVLGYPNIVRWMSRQRQVPEQVLAEVATLCHLLPEAVLTPTPTPTPSALRCRDPDDQKFIDLALAQRALLLSKDHEVLRLAQPLRGQGITVSAIFSLCSLRGAGRLPLQQNGDRSDQLHGTATAL